MFEKRDLMKASWIHHFSYSNLWLTRCFTLQLGDTSLGSDTFRDNIQLVLDQEAEWIIMLHDPAYYLLAMNDMVVPGIR